MCRILHVCQEQWNSTGMFLLLCRPRLGQAFHKVLFVGGLFFILAAIEGSMRATSVSVCVCACMRVFVCVFCLPVCVYTHHNNNYIIIIYIFVEVWENSRVFKGEFVYGLKHIHILKKKKCMVTPEHIITSMHHNNWMTIDHNNWPTRHNNRPQCTITPGRQYTVTTG